MFLYPLPALVTSFPRTFIIKGNVNNGRNPSSCLFPVVAFINKEVTSCVNEEATGAINEAAIDTMIVSLLQLHHQLIDLIFLLILQF